MSASYYYLTGTEGRRYCWSAEPSFECPIGSADTLGDILEKAAQEVGMDPDYLLRRIKHGGYRGRKNGGRLTDKCASCGHRLKRLGYRTWVQTGAVQGGSWFQPTRADARAWAQARARDDHKGGTP